MPRCEYSYCETLLRYLTTHFHCSVKNPLELPHVDVVYADKDCVAVVDATDNDSVHYSVVSYGA